VDEDEEEETEGIEVTSDESEVEVRNAAKTWV
jgi:hypothetical protein